LVIQGLKNKIKYKKMKQQINEVKRIQKLAGLIKESEELKEFDEFANSIASRAFDEGAFKEIGPDTEVKIGDSILVKTRGNYFHTVAQIKGDPLDPKTIYVLEYDDDGTKKRVTRKKLQDEYIVGVDGWKEPQAESINIDSVVNEALRKTRKK
jgi:hypothetical protein